MTKIMELYRHADNQGAMLTANGLLTIQQVFGSHPDQMENITEVFHSRLYQSVQTALGLAANLRAHLHDPVSLLGNDRLFELMFPPEVQNYMRIGVPALGALRQYHGEDQMRLWINRSIQGIKDMFTFMKGEHALVVGHEPLISLAVIAINGECQPVKYLEKKIFLRSDEGAIKIL